MRVAILCGGRGMRAWPATALVPKPMLRIGDRPVLEHVMETYALQGYCDFLLATGYKGDVIAGWADTLDRGWSVECLDTGEGTDTAARLRACANRVGGRFMATYGDGLGNVDITGLLRHHEQNAASATVTAVPLPSPYGTVDVDDRDRVVAFHEKPALPDHWVNAGFFVFEPAALLDVAGESLEREVLPALALAGGLYVYRHRGFWKSMDSHKDVQELNELVHEEGHPWLNVRRTSGGRGSSSPVPRGSSAHT